MADLWSPRFAIGKADPVATLGSCFAQHISKAMVAKGFNWMDGEPAPPKFPATLKPDFHYGTFSARTGNIYTVALLRQWVSWALEGHDPPREVWWRDGRVFDPFRPTVEQDGFASEDELIGLRRQTIAALRHVLETCSVFVFTLGLTEGWVNRSGGYVYPMCPGTLAGEFNAERHAFKNFDFFEIHEDLSAVLSMLRAANPKVRVILTVSPVPLTATASGDHVLVATTASKSILRAVAAAMVSAHDFVDYFPSYEIISGFPTSGLFYDANLRTVSAEGVAHVMSVFFKALGPQDDSLARSVDRKAVLEDVDAVCEEMMLAQYEP